MNLAEYAIRNEETRGRRYPENEHPYRTPFQRDRDRIIHSRAFRRLEYKTQVFVNHEGDHYRTRLTHSLEVSQIARTVSSALGLNVDLAEALALSHDMGHPPFGHSGQDVLDEMMKNHGGFEHNLQTLRIVEQLEQKYIEFPGLNLTFEVREGIVKHSASYKGMKNPPEALREYILNECPPLEAQIIDLCDEIAYNNHDLDDGLESRLLDLDDLVRNVTIFREIHQAVQKENAGAPAKLIINATIIRLINILVTDLVENCKRTLQREKIHSLQDVRNAPRLIPCFSDEIGDKNRELKTYLYKNLYTHYRVHRMKSKARRILDSLFRAYREDPALLPSQYQQKTKTEGKERIICDYIAGMTDRFAIEEYEKLFNPRHRV
ncbi:deoxyguanosinetriphosphate triphosphohydrolase [bacterium]|nr:deoxyguanosinetriphosphate triphosphohydrolase [bacterium]MCI0604964.1 deoxyguanosinetriphosphate triphosphohydrolase [bacterium]